MITADIIEVSSKKCFIFSHDNPEYLLIQPVGTHEIPMLDKELQLISDSGIPFRFIGIQINDWNNELSPWTAPAAFGDEPFGCGGKDTLDFIVKEICPRFSDNTKLKVILGGYSLAGLFSLWSGYETDFFNGIAAVSPSVWLDGWIKFAAENEIKTSNVYLSLGNREHKTRNPLLKTVKCCIEEQYSILKCKDVNAVLEWNEGNHFNQPELRMAKGFRSLMEMLK